ncbi:MAG: NAD-dependent epimerase/dehydratase family protein [Desulfobacteraceae bacterium]|nr:NAD-dependent epimerase/dehydratase family protein [Desulfobacteraceae bacterium]
MPADRIVLVTGGAGFLGSAIVRMLLARGEMVRTVSRGRYPELERLGVEHFATDLNDINALNQACRNVEAVFHVAAKFGTWGPYEEYYRANTLGTINVIQACKENGVSRLIFTSSPSVIFDGRDIEGGDESLPYPARFEGPYPETKALAEQAVLAAAREGLPAIALRPHLIWGPLGFHLVERILSRAKRLRLIGDGRNLVDTIYVDNAAWAHILAEQRLKENPSLSGRVYFISQDQPIAFGQMLNQILAAGGLPPVTRKISPRSARVIAALLEGMYRLLRIPSEPPLTRFQANAMAKAHWFNISAVKKDLGYAPIVSTEEGLRRLAEWLEKIDGSNS